MTDGAAGPADLRLYSELAEWWPLLSAPADYVEEAAFFGDRLREACARTPRTLLELGAGGGNNASHLKAGFEMTLVDLAPAMLDVSRALNPECEHLLGDMRTVRLGRRFDAVFVHDAVCYLTDESAVRAALATVAAHCSSGGAVVIAPDHVRENFAPSTEHGGHVGADGRALRYLSWSHDPDPDDSTYTVDYAYLLREIDGSSRAVHDRHIEGLFGTDDWLRWLRDEGIEARATPLEHSEIAPGQHVVFVGTRR